jgi:hypothetical protein
MKTLLILAGLGIFIWVLKVISDGLVDKVPKSWGINLANAKAEEYEVDVIHDPAFSSAPGNIWYDEKAEEDH